MKNVSKSGISFADATKALETLNKSTENIPIALKRRLLEFSGFSRLAEKAMKELGIEIEKA